MITNEPYSCKPFYNNQEQRERILKEVPNWYEGRKKRSAFLALCVFPRSWEATYNAIRNSRPGARIEAHDWEVLQGIILGILVLGKRKTKWSKLVVEETAIDFVKFIRTDKSSCPWRFANNWQRYLDRYTIIRSLKQFGIDWQDVAQEFSPTKRRPFPTTYSSLLTNRYVRNIVWATIVIRNFRSPGDEDYKEGENDFLTWVRVFTDKAKHLKRPKVLPEPEFIRLCYYLLERLPAWSQPQRAKLGMYLSYLLPLHVLVERQHSTKTKLKHLGENPNV